MSQSSFSDLEYSTKKKRTRKEMFLEQMDQILPWAVLLKPIKRHYPKVGNGRRPIDLEVMLRIYFLQQWYGLSDPAMEDSLYDIMSMRGFAGVDMDSIPDETTICRFRHLLERHHLTEKLFITIEQYLSEHELMLSEGTIVDASIISAPGSTKKGNQWYFGMKVHVGTDKQGWAHSIAVTDASVHDSQVMDDLIHGEEEEVYGDKAYADEGHQQQLESQGVTWRVSRKAKRNKKLNCADQSFNRRSNRARARVEHIFGVVKHLWGYRKVRYKGLDKNAAHAFTLFALANVYLARNDLAKL